VVTGRWHAEPPGDTWSTVMTWDNYGAPIEHDGVTYGSKEPQFAAIEDLPRRVEAKLEVAAGGVGAPRERWRDRGWSVVDSTSVSETLEDYRSYIQRSRGELSVAKNVYVATDSGWFSCRSVCYLAAGRPVVVEDTGFSRHLPVNEGLLAFRSADEAIVALRRVDGDYDRHSDAARDVAHRCFASDAVLTELLDKVRLS
jgi:hypothetical protein